MDIDGLNIEKHIQYLQEYKKLGFNNSHNVNINSGEFISEFVSKVLPKYINLQLINKLALPF